MQLKTISEISRAFGITTRTLRYYEQIGLLPSKKKTDYAYRAYDDDAVQRLQQIVVLRKLRIPLRQIRDILRNADARLALQVFAENLKQVEGEIAALETIRSVLKTFIDKLSLSVSTAQKLNLLADAELLEAVETLAITQPSVKENKTMEDLKMANETLDKNLNIRIIYLPPVTVAASQVMGEEPEKNAWIKLHEFITTSDLCNKKPDLRVYGFNNPNPTDESGSHGYEFWVTIPEDMEVAAPLEKKQFAGGLYASTCIKMGDFHIWHTFFDWAGNNDEYEYDRREPLGMDGLMEEHLNAYNHVQQRQVDESFIQLDLLLPIKPKNNGFAGGLHAKPLATGEPRAWRIISAPTIKPKK